MMKFLKTVLSFQALCLPLTWALPTGETGAPKPELSARMQKITSMYGFEGFVYALEVSNPDPLLKN